MFSTRPFWLPQKAGTAKQNPVLNSYLESLPGLMKDSTLILYLFTKVPEKW